MENPLVSVVIPVYNAGKHLNKCLDSIVNQTYKNLEIIVINDGSKDNSAEICRKYAEKDNRITFVSRENRGVSATRNEGINLARGDYFSFIDADDYLELDAYEYLIDIINEKQVDAINFEHFITYPTKEIIHRLADKNYGLFDRNGAQWQLVHKVAFAWNKLFSKKIIEGIQFDETIFRGEDSLFSRKAFDKAEKVWFDNRPLLHYVQSENSAVRGSFRVSQLSAVKLYDVYEKFYSENYPELLSKNNADLNLLMIMLYCDMYADENNFKSERNMVFQAFKKHYKTAVSCVGIQKKSKLKMKIFRFCPQLVAMIHTVLNN